MHRTDEVRQLAGRCAEAAKESARLIGDSAKDTATAIAKSDELATRFKNVSTSIHEVNDIVTQISTSFVQQADSIGQINQAVSSQRSIAQSVAAAAQQTASTAVSMEGQVESLQTGVDHMDTLLGGGRDRHETNEAMMLEANDADTSFDEPTISESRAGMIMPPENRRGVDDEIHSAGSRR